MPDEEKFRGFNKKSVNFFRDLEKNNSRDWFVSNKDTFDENVMLPAVLYVNSLGKKLRKSVPGITADPRRDKSIFRINRDTRFSNNKTPYKTHLGIYFWEGEGKKLDNPGFYFHFDGKNLLLAGGMHIIPRQYLKNYRDAVVDPDSGKNLNRIISKIRKNEKYKLGWEKYKKIPKGYDPQHPNNRLLLYGGIGFMYETKIPDELYSEELIDYTAKVFKDFLPLHLWLREMMER